MDHLLDVAIDGLAGVIRAPQQDVCTERMLEISAVRDKMLAELELLTEHEHEQECKSNHHAIALLWDMLFAIGTRGSLTSSVLGRERCAFWELLQESATLQTKRSSATSFVDSVDLVSSIAEVTSKAGKARSWLRLALNQRDLGHYLQYLFQHSQAVISKYYYDFAALSSSISQARLLHVCLCVLPFTFDFLITNPVLDELPWTLRDDGMIIDISRYPSANVPVLWSPPAKAPTPNDACQSGHHHHADVQAKVRQIGVRSKPMSNQQLDWFGQDLKDSPQPLPKPSYKMKKSSSRKKADATAPLPPVMISEFILSQSFDGVTIDSATNSCIYDEDDVTGELVAVATPEILVPEQEDFVRCEVEFIAYDSDSSLSSESSVVSFESESTLELEVDFISDEESDEREDDIETIDAEYEYPAYPAKDHGQGVPQFNHERKKDMLECLHDCSIQANDAVPPIPPHIVDEMKDEKSGGASEAAPDNVLKGVIIRGDGHHISMKLSFMPMLSAADLLELQHGQCRQCRESMNNLARQCWYSGHLYCTSCHLNEVCRIPPRMLAFGDARYHPVCHLVYRFLQQMQHLPIISMSMVPVDVFEHSWNLQSLYLLRKQISLMSGYINTCRSKNQLLSVLGSRTYFLQEHNRLFTINDIGDALGSKLCETLLQASDILEKHIVHCTQCRAKAFFCEGCRDDRAIFPFQLTSTRRCKACGALFHKNCRPNPDVSCTKCQRLERRSNSKQCALKQPE